MIQYIKGDATYPQGDGNKIIVHICNDIGKWGSGFVLAISKRWLKPKDEYMNWYSSKQDFKLGNCQIVKVSNDIYVANLIGQHKIVTKYDITYIPIRYDAIEIGLKLIKSKAQELNASLHMPRIGCGLAKGDWNIISGIIERIFVDSNIKVYVYDL